MNCNSRVTLLLCCVLSVLACPFAGGQQPVTGTPPLSSFSGGPFDAINLANLDVHFSIPILSKAGKGLPFYFNLAYDGLVWSPVDSTGNPNWTHASNWGWTDQTNAQAGYVTPLSATSSFRCVDGGFKWTFGPFTYVDTSGTAHPFAGTATYTNDSSGCGPDRRTLSSHASDNSGLFLNVTVNSLTSVTATVTNRSGIVFNPGQGTITDPNGNVISISSGTITDTLLTTALKISGTNPVIYQYMAPSGTWAQVQVNYSTYKVETNFGVQGINDYGQDSGGVNNLLVSSIVMPDGSRYSFSYEPTYQGSPNTVTGRLAKVTLPTGGVITYSYASQPGGSDNSMLKDGSPSRMSRTLGGGTYQYTRAAQAGQQLPQALVTITDPGGNETDLNFSGIYETSRQVYQGAQNSGTLMNYSYRCYNGNSGTTCLNATVSQPVKWLGIQNALNTNPNGNGAMWSAVQLTYDCHANPSNCYGNVVEEDDIDYGTTSSGHTLLRKVTTTYNSSLCTAPYNICDRPYNITTTDGANTKAITTFAYDEDSPLTHGSVTTIGKWVAQSSPYLYQHYSYYAGGTINVAEDPNGTTATYGYGGTSCNNGFPTSVTVPGAGGNLVTSYTYNCTGGVVISTTDPNGQIAYINYTKDPYFWRPESTKDALGNTTYYNYYGVSNAPGNSNALSVGQVESVMSWTSSQGNATVDHLITPDTLGREWLGQSLDNDNGGWDTVETVYNSVGQVYLITSPYISTAGADKPYQPAESWVYDGFNRVVDEQNTFYPIDIHYSYNLNDVEVTLNPAPSGEHAKSRQMEYDGLGRLTSVCELLASGGGSCQQNNPGANGYFTSYQYDPLGNLTSVTQSTQSRSFTYDGLSRMTQESNPETSQTGTGGSTSYIYDSDTTCNSTTPTGNLLRRVDPAGNTTCYGWDGLHRLTHVTYPSGPNSSNTLSKTFIYDISLPFGSNGPTATNPKGRLVGAYPGNYAGGEAFGYDMAGNTTDFYETTPNSGGWYHIINTYAPNGLVWGRQGYLGYSGGTPFTNGLSYVVNQEGRLNGLWDQGANEAVWVSSTYKPAGQPNFVNFYSGDGESFSWDQTTGHMTGWDSSVGTHQQTGTLTWNANGTLQIMQINDSANILNTQTCNYAYDDLVRVSSVSCPAKWTQTFTYDQWSNINKSGSISFSSQGGTGNHVPGFGYDPNGNVTNDGITTNYAYDSEGRPVTVGGTTASYDAFNRPVELHGTSGYTQIVYAPDGFKFAYMNGQTWQKYIAPLAGGLQAVYTPATAPNPTYWRHSDWLGSSRLATTPAQTVYYDGAYAPFGESYSEIGTHDRSFTAQTQDMTSPYYDFLFRQQSSAQGRWMVPDPAGLAAANLADPQTWNRYAYLRNNPLRAVDRFGLDEFDLGGGLSFGTYIIDTDLESFVAGGDDFSGVAGDSIDGSLVFTGDQNSIDLNSNLQQIPISTPGSVMENGDVVANLNTQLLFQGNRSTWIAADSFVKTSMVSMAVGGITGCLVGSALSEFASAAAASTSEVPVGTPLWRVFGGEARGLGNYYTTVDPATITNYRFTAGLYSGNTGQFVLRGTLNNAEGALFRTAAAGEGGVGGGLPEVFVLNPELQITIQQVSGVNPPF